MKFLKNISTLFFLLMLNVATYAQCSMCSATLESSKSEGGITGAGINTGVAYLAVFPYLVIGLIGFIIYKKMKTDANDEA